MVEKALNEMGFVFLEQATFLGMVYKKQLFYDFLIDSEDIIIEFQGLQHYEPVEYLGGFLKFKSQVERYKIKEQFAIRNSYILIEVPHTYDNQERVNRLLQDILLA